MTLQLCNHTTMVRNIASVLANATPAETAEGIAWYSAARTFAIGLADRYQLPGGSDQAAAIIAVLSPQRSWGDNQRAADYLCRYGITYGLGQNVRKSMRLLDGEAPSVVLAPPNPRRNTGSKVRSFFANIAGCEDSVTVDRHAAAVVMYGTDHAKEAPGTGGWLDSAGRYDKIADAYRAAAEGTGYTPAQVQAITWVVRRNRRHPNNRHAYS